MKRLTKAQVKFLTDAADNAGMKTVYGNEGRTRDILVAAGLVKMGRTVTAYLTRAGYAAIGRESDY